LGVRREKTPQKLYYCKPKTTSAMATLKEDIQTQSDWLVKAFAADGLTLDYTLASLIAVDRFFALHAKNGHAVKGGRLAQNFGAVIFAIGAYVGQTIIAQVPGAVWLTDDNDPQGEITAAVQFTDGTTMWPMQKVMKRFKNGAEDSIYLYAYHITKDHTSEPYTEGVWDALKEDTAPQPWWRFWGK